MANDSGKVFLTQLNAIENLGRAFGKRTKQYDVIMQKRMTQATDIVWRLAHQRRPYISKEQQKSGFHTKSGNVHFNRVSDPGAELGVPVAAKNGGLLQSAIKKQVSRLGYGKFQGVVYVDAAMAPYGKFMEYGTSKVHARPFMRPAQQLSQAALHKLFQARAEIK